MSTALRSTMTRDEFFAWAEAREERYEFDGFAPVGMTGGSVAHSRMIRNIMRELLPRLRGGRCEPLGPDAGIATIGDAVRYPDAVVTCSPVDGRSRLVPNPVIVFEVVSPTSVRTDRVVKLREYAAVPSIRRYIIVEPDAIALTVFSRGDGTGPFLASGLAEGDELDLPELGIAIPVADLYDGLVAASETPLP